MIANGETQYVDPWPTLPPPVVTQYTSSSSFIHSPKSIPSVTLFIQLLTRTQAHNSFTLIRMSSPACRKFFELPELFQQLCSFLRPHDLAKLLRISRDLYYVTGPHFWQHIDLEDDRKVDRLITTPEALEAFAKNVPFMHTLTAGFIFVSYYFEGIMRYLDEQELLPKRTCSLTGNTEMQRPLWLPQAIVRTPSARPLPPMIRLSQLDICFQRQYRGVQFDNVMRLNKPVRLFRPLVWLMNLNAAGLTHVCFRYMDLPDPLELRCLARSLSDLRNLTHLTIDMLSTGLTSWLSAPFVFVLFFALPRSVVSVKLEAMLHASSDDEAEERRLRVVPDTCEEGDEDEEEIEPSPDWVEGDLVAREESLERLKELVLPSYKMGYTADQIRRILRHCPVLERWDIPCLRDERAAEALTGMIREMVLQEGHGLIHQSRKALLRHLSSKHPWRDSRGERLVSVLDALPEQRVESVQLNQFMDTFPDAFAPALLRHCEALQSIVFLHLEKITSRTIAMILSRCHGLEKFWATGTYGQPIYLNLNDAIEQEWVCKEIEDLRITVDLSALSKQGLGRSAGGERRKVEAGESFDILATKEYWTKLGIFYTQLGKLTELEALELIAADVERGWNWSSTYMSEALPGLLSLEEEDKETKKRGFLSLLGGLKKLRVVHGSFWSGSRDASKTFGQRETEWVVKNWPALEQIELLPQKYMRYAGFDMPKHLGWLREEKPELQLCR
ncbi:hypothetical protein BKA57DRAFT_472547 [Linnemannia elongata]|nr:hypothetical protein BKA57DRAFT_472547 [Linnemannia elongata]